jgi:hypothetical protein
MVKAAVSKAKVSEQNEADVTVARATGSVDHTLGCEEADEMERKARLGTELEGRKMAREIWCPAIGVGG